MGKSGLPDIYTQSPRAPGLRAEGVYIRQTTSAHITTIMSHLVIGYILCMSQIKVTNIKSTSTTTPYLLGNKYNCEIIYVT